MRKLFLITIILLISTLSFSQGWIHSGNFDPDSLKSITVSGKIISDSITMNGMYFLDVNRDNTPDYILIFGPYWYNPDSSLAVRPAVGDSIKITGGLFEGMNNYMPSIVVYNVNGNFWRSPFDSYWDDMGYNSMMGGYQHMDMGYSFGWNHDTLTKINLSGKILIDSTLIYKHYYLSINNDSIPDYYLNFGPPWYRPSSNISLPLSGENVSISGWEINTGISNMIIINKLNDQIWMDSTRINNNLGSGWIYKNMSQYMQFYSPFDTSNWIQFNPGWDQSGMMGGGMMYDSLYCQILETYPENVPDDSSQNIMAAFEVGVFYPNGENGMWQSSGMGGMMNFNSMVNFQFHFNNIQSNGFNINSNNLKVMYWDQQNYQWVNAQNALLNTADNTVSVSQNQVSNFYIVTADKVTGTGSSKNSIIRSFALKQNYPNPFNPSTTIIYSLKQDENITLKVYNILGKVVANLFNGNQKAGTYNVTFNASNMSSGVYFYQLKAGNFISTKKMVLLK